MAWLWLLAAGICEVVWAFGLKRFGLRPTPGGIATIIVMLLSFVLLERSMRSLPLGTSYAVWTGIGAVGATLVGMAVLGEPRDLPRVVCLTFIICGIVGLKWWAPS